MPICPTRAPGEGFRHRLAVVVTAAVCAVVAGYRSCTTIDEWVADCCHDRHGGKQMTAADIRKDGKPNHLGGEVFDAWDGQFITTHNGRLPNPLALGRLLTGQIGRWRGPYVLRGGKNERGGRNVFWVERETD
ncbi:hypothetical protein [Krasilnikovia sp. M28-CT-15]|uniref:hypothetical protein n=1 Tax=Krasilnikovia sp. M28-CT-15 TaxID=3373540 RepID=UPI00399D2B53